MSALGTKAGMTNRKAAIPLTPHLKTFALVSSRVRFRGVADSGVDAFQAISFQSG